LANFENKTNSDILSESEQKPAFEEQIQMFVQARSLYACRNWILGFNGETNHTQLCGDEQNVKQGVN
jgi:hypothetical protein